MVILGDKGLQLILLSINGKNFYENSYRLGGGHGPPGPPLNPRLYLTHSKKLRRYFKRIFTEFLMDFS